MVGHRGAARGANRIRRSARAGFVAVHPRHGGICDRRRGHGAASRSDRHPGPDRRRRDSARDRLCRRRQRRQPRRFRACPHDHRVWQFGHARTADGRYFAMVCPPARPRGDALFVRKLFRRRTVAADRAAIDRALRLAHHAYRHRTFCERGDAARRPCGLATARTAHRRDRERTSYHLARDARPFAARAASPARDRLGVLLRRDVNAAGSHRRLLRRPRIRRRPRRRHVVADDGVRVLGRILSASFPIVSAACAR